VDYAKEARVRGKVASGLAVAGLLLALWGQARPLGAQAAARFTVTVASAYLRHGADMAAVRTYSVFQGQTYNIRGRTADSTWVSLEYTAATQGTWIPASYGDVAGRLADVPVLGSAAGAAVAPTRPPTGSAGATALPPAPVVAAGPAGEARQQLTITINSTYVRTAPDWAADKVASLFRGATAGISARDAFGNWLQLASGGWVPAGVGTLSGQVMLLPVSGAITLPTPAPTQIGQPPPALPAYVPVMTARMRNLYNLAALRGRNPRVFAVAGDCNSERHLYSDLIYNGWYGYLGNEYLHNTWRYFGHSMRRASLAVDGGFNSASIQDPAWADPALCRPGETPFACELRVSNASIVFIQLGTGDHLTWRSFEANYRKLIETAVASNVLPVVVTKADSLESQEGGAEPGTINDTIRKLAAEYEVPLLDFEMATRVMENHGLVDEPGNDFHLSFNAINLHVLSTMETLYAIRGW
jgi:hypothetical protein